MKERTRKMLDEVNSVHDWARGQVYSNGGTEYHSTDTCMVCGLRRHWKDDTQNGIDNLYRFSLSDEDLSLSTALDRGCP
jgi:hypothetical protein